MDYAKIIKNEIIPHFNDHVRIVPIIREIKGKLVGLCLSGEISEMDFYKSSFLLTPQSRSPLWESYFIQKHRCTRNGKNLNAGDFNMNGINYEFKVSANMDNVVNIVQIRPWQQCDYIIQVIQIEREKIHLFELTHGQMLDEMKILKASVAHGTRIANENNRNIEYRASLVIGSERWQYWMDNYRFGNRRCK